MALNKADLKEPVRRKETVDVPELKELLPEGASTEMVVQMMKMSDRLYIATAGFPPFVHIAEVLARSVIDSEGDPVWTVEQWETFGVDNEKAAWRLFEVAQRLSKLGAPEEKKADTPS